MLFWRSAARAVLKTNFNGVVIMLTVISIILTVIGSLNWLLVGIFGFNLVAFLFGTSVFAVITYVLIGAAGIWLLYFLIRSKFHAHEVAENMKRY